MVRSYGFGSKMNDLPPLRVRFRFGLFKNHIHKTTCFVYYADYAHLATQVKSPAHSSTGTSLTVKSLILCLLPHGFKFFFSPLTGFFSTFPHGTLTLSVSAVIYSYEVVSADSEGISRVPTYLGFNFKPIQNKDSDSHC